MSEKEVMTMNDKEVEMNEQGSEASRREEMTEYQRGEYANEGEQGGCRREGGAENQRGECESEDESGSSGGGVTRNHGKGGTKGNLETLVREEERVTNLAEREMKGLSEGMLRQLHDVIGDVVRNVLRSELSEGKGRPGSANGVYEVHYEGRRAQGVEGNEMREASEEGRVSGELREEWSRGRTHPAEGSRQSNGTSRRVEILGEDRCDREEQGQASWQCRGRKRTAEFGMSSPVAARRCMATEAGGATPLGLGTRQIVVHAPAGSPDQEPDRAGREGVEPWLGYRQARHSGVSLREADLSPVAARYDNGGLVWEDRRSVGAHGCVTTDAGGSTPPGVGIRQIVVHTLWARLTRALEWLEGKEWSHVWGTGRPVPRD